LLDFLGTKNRFRGWLPPCPCKLTGQWRVWMLRHQV